MRIEFPFNEQLHVKMYEDYLRVTYERINSKLQMNLVSGGFLVVFGIGMPLLKVLPFKWMDVAAITFGSTYLLITLSAITRNLKYKKYFRDRLRDECAALRASQQPIVIEYDEEWFSLENVFAMSRLKWEWFEGYRLIENNLYLDINRTINLCFIVNRQYVGDAHFDELVELVSRKLSVTPRNIMKRNNRKSITGAL